MVEKICLDQTRKPFFLRDDGEELIISMAEGMYTVSEMGAMIIRELNNGKAIDDIIKSILYEYDVSDSELFSDVISFFHSLNEIKILSDEKTALYCSKIREKYEWNKS